MEREAQTLEEENILIEKLVLWNSDAFHMLYKRYYKALVNYAVQYVNDSDIAEDIVQEHFSNMWESKREFTSIYALEVFLYNSVKNRCLNYLKHLDVEQNYIHSIINDSAEISEDSNELFSERVYAMLFAAIDNFPERRKEVFLQYMAGKSNNEIAQNLGISLETVKTQKKRSMVFLREYLNKSELDLLFAILSVL